MSRIKDIIKKILIVICSLFPIDKKMIIFESCGEIKDNSKSLYEELLKLKLNEKYKIVWLVNDVKKYKNSKYANKNVIFVKKLPQNNKNLKFVYYCCRAKYCFYTHCFIGLRRTKGQIKVFLTHGVPIKDSTGLFWEPYKNTYIISTSEYARFLRCKTFEGGEDITEILGFPRNDKLFEKDFDTVKFLNKYKYNKLILWLPTFKHNNLETNRNDFALETQNDISIMSEEFLKDLNKKLKELSILLIIKFHPGQNINYVKIQNYSNILMMTNNEMESKNIDLYSLMAESNAIITDYSSVYIDYLLLDRPIRI